jgi:hypothetical protein
MDIDICISKSDQLYRTFTNRRIPIFHFDYDTKGTYIYTYSNSNTFANPNQGPYLDTSSLIHTSVDCIID